MKRWKHAILLLTTLMFSVTIATTAWAQNTITGKVTAKSDGSALPGVNILVKGTTSGTATAPNGSYTVNVPSMQDTLVFSYIGYKSQVIPINGRSTIDVVLESETYGGQELVVVGYGTQEKKSITGSVSSVSSKDFRQGLVNNPMDLIQGKVAGLSITKPGSNPNQSPTIRLRGLSTLGGNTEPLIVVDGVPGASLSSIDPNDIKSINVLKDASASAIYGTRAASGVILITTKSGTIGGKGGKPTFNMEYNGSTSINTPYRMPKVLSSKQYLALLQQYDPAAASKLNHGSTTDWLKAITQTGFNTVQDFAVSGGSDQTAYRASINYRDVQGIQKGTGFKQLNGMLHITQYALNNNLTVKMNLSANSTNRDIGMPDAFRYATIYNPTSPIKGGANAATYGGYWQNNLFDYFNPVAMIQQDVQKGTDRLLSGSLQGSYDFSQLVPGLSLSAMYSEQRTANNHYQYYPSTDPFRGYNLHGLSIINNDNADNVLFQSIAHYQHSITGKLNVEALAGYQWQQFTYDGQYIYTGNYLTDSFLYNNLGGSQNIKDGLTTLTSYKNSNKDIAFFGRLNLNYGNIFFLQGSLRHEGSTQFGANNKWGNFPGGSFGVELTNLVNLPHYFNSVKPRVGYGVTGNTPPQSYLSLPLLGPTGQSYLLNGQWIPSYGPTQNPNPNLKWETKRELDIGLDIAMWDSRLQASFDYYTDKTKDLIYQATVPVPPNFSSNEWINIGDLANKGFEGTISYDVIRGSSFSWTSNANFSVPQRTKLVKLSNSLYSFGKVQEQDNLGSPGQNGTTLVKIAEGEALGQLIGYVFQGVNPDGTWKFKDVNGDGVINQSDRVVIGNGLPTFDFGFGNNFRYQNWSLNIHITGTFGHDLLNTFRAFYSDPAIPSLESYNALTSSLDPVLKGLNVPPTLSSYDVQKASYVKVDNVTLGYSFPMKAGFPVQSLRLYLTGQNLWTFTNYTGPDPTPQLTDVGNSDNGGFPAYANNPNPLWIGIARRNTWFSAREITFGVDIKF
ncbi:MAG TPA: SusC/RagA family TonB-linked outer membrane protein [Balneolales bacterium]|nr:SusC/RagA family TonB-linked outer membrane protein [Balneolales bacterium]